MVFFQNQKLRKEISRAAGLGELETPSELARSIVPVIEVNPKNYRRIARVKTATASNATSATIYTTPSDKDFFLTGAMICWAKDATPAATTCAITCVVNGETISLLNMADVSANQMDPTPVANYFGNIGIKIDRGTAINVTNGVATANIKAVGTIWGYEEDNFESV